jgi:hypothetical protein
VDILDRLDGISASDEILEIGGSVDPSGRMLEVAAENSKA